MLIAISVSIVFLAISLLHGYWALGGRRCREAAIPKLPARLSGRDQSVTETQAAFNPSPAITLAVAAALAMVAMLIALYAGLLGEAVKLPVLRWALMAVAVVMLLRAVGDFRLVGFFKTLKMSRFAALDTLYFSPLCIALGLGLMTVAAN
jgi:cation transport ATPase